MSAAKPVLRAKVLHLRKTKRLSNREIEKITGASKGSVSNWLRKHPLTEQERKAKYKSKRARQAPPPTKITKGSPSSFWIQANGAKGFTTLQKGKIAEAAVLFRMTLLGLPVFGSLFDGDKADWMVETPGGIRKIQVRSCKTRSSGSPSVCLTRTNHKGKHLLFQKGDFDFIVGYDLYSDTAFVFSWDEVKNKTASISCTSPYTEAWGKLK